MTTDEATPPSAGPEPGQESFQLSEEAAEAYEALFVPSIFADWAPHTLDASGAEPGHRLLDVACGTGIVARTAADRLGPDARITGVDRNEAMLAVARRVRPELTWRRGEASELPFPEASFDAVTCQMALMFFPDPVVALAEMARVVRPGGGVGLVVPAPLEAQPAYRPFVEVAVANSGPEARALLSAYFACGDLPVLVEQLTAAGLVVADQRTRTGPARFESSDAMVATEVEGSPLMERIDEATYGRIKAEVATRLAHYVTPDGRFEIPLVCQVIGARRPG